MTGERRAMACVTLTALMAQWSYAIAGEKPLFFVLGAGVALLSTWVVERRLTGQPPVPGWLLNTLVVLAALNLIWEFLRPDRQDVISRLSDFLSLVMLTKMLDRRRVRDERQLLSLSVFVTLGAVLTGQSLGLGLALLAMTPLAVCSAVMLQLLASGEGQRESVARAGTAREGEALRRRWVELRTMRSAWRLGVLCVMAGAAGGVVVFMLAPRQVAGQLGGVGGARTGSGSVTGYRDQFRLGESGLLSQSNETVMDILVRDGLGGEVRELSAPLYLRGNVLTRYDAQSGQWTRGGPGTESELEPGTRVGSGSMAVGDRSSGRVAMTVEISQRSAQASQLAPLFAPLRVVQVKGPSQSTLRFDAGTTLLSGNWAGGRLAYTVVSMSGYTERNARAARVDTSAVPAAARELAQEVLRSARVVLPAEGELAEASVARAAAQAVSGHLRRSFGYTLEMQGPPEGSGMDPLTYFLTERRQGHCEYFAAAMVAMLQGVGVPARVVTGYVAQEFNDLTGHFVVRQSDAHAWAEVQIEAGRWESFDPTPPAGLLVTQRREGGVGAWVRQVWEAVEFSWLDNVVAYESGVKIDLVAQLSSRRGSEATARLTRSVSGVQSWVRRNLPGDTLVGVVVVVVGAVVALGLVVLAARGLVRAVGWLARRWGLRGWLARWGLARGQRGSSGPVVTAQTKFYAEMLTALRHGGLAKPTFLPPMLHARGAVRVANAPAGGAAEGLTGLYYAARFGGRELSEAERAQAAAGLLDLRRALEPQRKQ